MHGVAFDIDSAIWSRGANIFASAASDAKIDVRFGDRQSIVAVGNHFDRLGRTVFGTGAAVLIIDRNDTVFFDEDDVSDLDFMFLFNGKRLAVPGARNNRVCGTDVGADGAVEVAEAVREVHARLEESHQTVFKSGGFQDSRGAFCDAQVA